jgi:NADH-quinone oxidoreductase subunit L
LTSVLTAAYATRLWALTFLGAPKEKHATPKTMALVLLILALAVFALSVGQPLHLGIAALSTGAAVVGVLFGWLLRKRTFESRAGRVVVSELEYDRVFSRFIPAIARFNAQTVVWADETLIDSYPRGSEHSALGAGWLMDRLQTAKSQLYATAIVLGSLALVAYAMWVGR